MKCRQSFLWFHRYRGERSRVIVNGALMNFRAYEIVQKSSFTRLFDMPTCENLLKISQKTCTSWRTWHLKGKNSISDVDLSGGLPNLKTARSAVTPLIDSPKGTIMEDNCKLQFALENNKNDDCLCPQFKLATVFACCVRTTFSSIIYSWNFEWSRKWE